MRWLKKRKNVIKMFRKFPIMMNNLYICTYIFCFNMMVFEMHVINVFLIKKLIEGETGEDSVFNIQQMPYNK